MLLIEKRFFCDWLDDLADHVLLEIKVQIIQHNNYNY